MVVATRRAVVLGGNKYAPVLDLNLTTSSTLDSRFSVSRASGGSYFDVTGTLQTAANNTARIDYPYTAGSSNAIRNSTMQGQVNGSPGTLPTNWNLSGVPAGITATVTAVTDGGMPCLDVRFNGTAGSSAAVQLLFENLGGIPAALGQQWNVSSFLRIVAAPTPGDASAGTLTINVRTWDSGGTILNTGYSRQGPNIASGVSALTRYNITATVDAATTASLITRLLIGLTSGQTYDFTFRVGGPQASQSATVQNYTPTTGTAVSNAATPTGLLIEPSGSSNGIRNPRCEGAVAPSTFSTNWGTNTPAGVTATIVGTGSENGLPYVDIAWNGTATGAGALGPVFESGTQIAATTGQTWTISTYCRLIAGSMTNISAGGAGCDENTAAGAFVAGGQTSTFTPTTAALATQRSAYTRTLSGGGTVGVVMPYMRFTGQVGAISVTLRFSAPQAEQSPFATSPMLPTAGSPAATTRASETITASAASFFTGGPTTFKVDAISRGTDTTGNPAVLARLDDTFTGNNRFQLGFGANTQNPNLLLVSGGTVRVNRDETGVAIGNPVKLAAAVTPSGAWASSFNGATPFTATGATMPTGITTLKLANGGASAAGAACWIRAVTIWQRALSNAELQKVTT